MASRVRARQELRCAKLLEPVLRESDIRGAPLAKAGELLVDRKGEAGRALATGRRRREMTASSWEKARVGRTEGSTSSTTAATC